MKLTPLLLALLPGCNFFLLNSDCGDDITSAEEACDDGNDEGGDGCAADCAKREVCGDDTLDAGEVCDDGNNDDGDGCRADCLGEEVCGDGIVDLEEACDDGNDEGGDGCDSLCATETGFSCREEPSVCTAICGDGLLLGAEECEDANTSSGDGCSALCLVEFCGDALVNNNNDEVSFSGVSAVNATSNGERMALADLNNDGRLDAITASPTFGGIRVLLGEAGTNFDAPGTFFRSSVALGALARVTDVTVGDLNADGNLDAVASNGIGSIGVFFGNGDGSFDAVLELTAELGTAGVVIVDIDADSILDLASANLDSRTITLYHNNGDNTFTERPKLAVDGVSPASITTGDANDDDKPDLFVCNFGDNSVNVFLGAGNSAFQAPKVFTSDGNPKTIEAADLNKDGKLDLVVAGLNGSVVNVFFGDNAGNFELSQALEGTQAPNDMTIADVNLDGDLDLLIADNNNRFGVFLGNAGIFPDVFFVNSGDVTDVEVGDIDLDGKPDLVGSSRDSNDLGTILNTSVIELCDDGNDTNGDGCDNDCTFSN